ncbi:MAG: DNA gyrase inhibitor YacG [Xanthobacteraceae bacterium]
MNPPSEEKPGGAGEPRACPICGRAAVERYRPFCSARCADVDLHRWLSGRYAIPAVEGDDDDEPDPPPPR